MTEQVNLTEAEIISNVINLIDKVLFDKIAFGCGWPVRAATTKLIVEYD